MVIVYTYDSLLVLYAIPLLSNFIFVFALLVSIVTYFSSILVISLISLAFGAMIAAKKKQSKGLLVGFGVTVFYSVIIYIVCLIINGGFSFNMFELFKLVAALIVGGLGGVLGVNMQE